MADLASDRRKQLKTSLRGFIPITTVLVIWEVLSRTGVISPMFFPAPTDIVLNLAKALISDNAVHHSLVTLRRILFGGLVGGSAGLVLGLMMGRWNILRDTLDPVLSVLHPLPKITLFPLVIVILGLGESARTAVIALGAFFPMLITATAAVRELPQDYIDIAHSYGARRMLILRRVVWPAITGPMLVGMRLSLNTALLITVTAELISSRDGLGWMVERAWRTFRITDLYSALVLIGVIGWGIRSLIDLIRRLWAPWSVQNGWTASA